MSDSKLFKKLINEGNESGEVVSSDRFLARVHGLNKTLVGSTVVFENGDFGLVDNISEDYVEILNLNSENVSIGSLVVQNESELCVNASHDMLGRIINPLGNPVDNLGIISKQSKV